METNWTKSRDVDGWDDSDWGWKDDEADGEEVQETDSLSWLQDCRVSLSPAGELMVLANEDRLVLLAQKYSADEDEVELKYSMVYEGCVKQEDNEKITCVLCVPLASQKRSTQGGPDWTCVFVGFSSGYVRMFTENGTLLLSQLFSMEPVVNIKCRTYEPPRHTADVEKAEELNILYKKSLVSVDGFSLFQSLRACRNQVARAAASGADFMQPPPLAYKKWALQEHELVADQASCGTITPNPFDQMSTASMIGGYAATIRPTPPASHLYLTAGKTPYAGFFYIVEGSTQPMLSDVAHAVASKLKSALFSQISAASGWFGLGGKQTPETSKEKKRPKIEPATTVTARHGMHDKRRQGESVVLSPDNKMAVTTDSFGRVILFDVMRGIAVRIWKGYRDAQVAWVEVKEDPPVDKEQRSKAVLRRALFLVIYAPRRGILEVWTAQQGPRVAAFNVSKWCYLLCPSYGLMGLNNATYRDVKVHLHHLYLIDPEGSVKTIEIPFHLALSDKNSKRARDQHLLKKLKISLKENQAESGALKGEVIDLLMDMKIASIRHQGLERVLLTKYLSVGFLEAVIKAVISQLQSQAQEAEMDRGIESETLDYESKVLLHFCKAQEHLIKTYSALHALNSDVQEKNGQTDIENLEEKLTKILALHPAEIKQIKAELDSYERSVAEKSRVTFESDYSMSVVEFLSCFECQMQKGEKSEAGSVMTVKVFSALTESRKMKLGNFLFKAVLEVGTSSDYNLLLKESHILPEDLMALLIQLWLYLDNRNMGIVGNLYSLVKSITMLKDSCDVTSEHSRVSAWWRNLRDMLIQTNNVSSALLAALVARSVAMEIGKATMTQELVTPTMDDSTKHRLSEWESVTVDKTEWTVLVKQLEDLLVLQSLLKMRPVDMGVVAQAPWQCEAVEVTVKKVMDGGRGMLPEFIAKWITGHGIAPGMLTVKQDAESLTTGAEPTEDPGSGECAPTVTENPIVCQLQAIQIRLPFSLDADILMANCAWEYMVIWNKDPEVILPLELALSYLRCIQNAALQHGVSVMMWQMFIVKKFSAAALLVEKVGKAPKDRLCRKEVGLSEMSLEKFMKNLVDLLDTIAQSAEETNDIPVLNIEDLWQNVQGPTSLAELALEQKPCNVALVAHHHSLCGLLYAVLAFSLKSVKPLSLYDTRGRNAFFKPLQSAVSVPGPAVDEALIGARKQVMCRVLTQAVQSLGEPPHSTPPQSPTHKLPAHCQQYTQWFSLMHKSAKTLSVDQDDVNRHVCCELYSGAWDKLAEEVLLTVNNHEDMGSQLLVISGKRLHHYIFELEAEKSVDIMSKCSTRLSQWLKSLDASQLHVAGPPIQDTATLIGHTVNALAEGHAEYNLAVELVELVQGFL